ncbi:MAG: hypothetical protein JF586_20760 [Burkholderiales bacterium]|jgi:hypothetical protein|nr:hypothetical protein [Burkholderiales bacterium]
MMRATRCLASVLGATVLAACAAAVDGGRQSLAGRYEATFVDRGSPKTVTLDCPSERRCTLVFADEPPIDAPDVQPIVDPSEARFALGYAVEHADAPPEPGDSPFADRLAPLLHASPEIVACWDIGDSDRDYLLACRLRSGGRIDPRVFVFATVLAGCGPRSCRFDIIPLHEMPR